MFVVYVCNVVYDVVVEGVYYVVFVDIGLVDGVVWMWVVIMCVVGVEYVEDIMVVMFGVLLYEMIDV